MFDDNARVVILRQPTQHDHYSDDDTMIQDDSFREAVKERVRRDPSRTIKCAYDGTAASVARGGYLRLNRHSIPEFHHIRTSVSKPKFLESRGH